MGTARPEPGDPVYRGVIRDALKLARSLHALGWNEALMVARGEAVDETGTTAHQYRRHAQHAIATINRALRELERCPEILGPPSSDSEAATN